MCYLSACLSRDIAAMQHATSRACLLDLYADNAACQYYTLPPPRYFVALRWYAIAGANHTPKSQTSLACTYLGDDRDSFQGTFNSGTPGGGCAAQFFSFPCIHCNRNRFLVKKRQGYSTGFDAPGTICQVNCSFTICTVPGFDAQCEVPVAGDPDIGDAATICRACGQPGEKCCNGDEPG